MILSISGQAQLFLLSIALGGAMGWIYDGLRLFRRMMPHGRVLVQTEDALYWLFLAPAVFWVLLKENSGELRFFIFLGLGGGLLLYFLVLSPPVLKVGEGVLRLAARVIRLLFDIIMTPFRLLFYVIGRPAGKIGGFCGRKGKKCLQLCKGYVKIKLRNLRRELAILRKKP
ncbi:spore cortex biosynthesis protein YabQ [Anaerotignum lactatifermentans]|uniref:Spore cortex biosynthesis protein YabQ n=1 Tax=Anaerotignum lactatifermentans TaxID=160404 RepID=A0ABS2GB28_9FIRM|nr:spore cortex biosynthesis protein YabQ [Anaerotignum lactatifermentans]MBM6829858.1 spore cortex biosynthesis protein YabQ [Anaerotignum lactatifermentans]MBM6878360.1 spore cortex biosynthesis protein YabQ [Anaerotignum lactatifermentans]MBM6951515.1 spore cortex biosynthesis protein YabQ [Anaerotignum lactatifermentans]